PIKSPEVRAIVSKKRTFGRMTGLIYFSLEMDLSRDLPRSMWLKTGVTYRATQRFRAWEGEHPPF
ncbi:MAG: hypothetical protein VX034_06390, partial [Planctomycetota bacterium]|nr:hypothetical protein [Planctomycetota bacterium]